MKIVTQAPGVASAEDLGHFFANSQTGIKLNSTPARLRAQIQWRAHGALNSSKEMPRRRVGGGVWIRLLDVVDGKITNKRFGRDNANTELGFDPFGRSAINQLSVRCHEGIDTRLQGIEIGSAVADVIASLG